MKKKYFTEEEKKQAHKLAQQKWINKNKEYYKKYYINNKNNEEHIRKRNKTNLDYYYRHKDDIKPIVYKYIEISTGDLAYIGSTGNLNRRINSRVCKKKRGSHFDILYRENPDNFKFEIICEFDTREEAYEYEYSLIRELKPKYNVKINN